MKNGSITSGKEKMISLRYWKKLKDTLNGVPTHQNLSKCLVRVLKFLKAIMKIKRIKQIKITNQKGDIHMVELNVGSSLSLHLLHLSRNELEIFAILTLLCLIILSQEFLIFK